MIIFELGKYNTRLPEKCGNRIYSDIDCVFIVKDGFKPDSSMRKLAKRDYWAVYEIGKVDKKFPVQVLVYLSKHQKDKKLVKLFEKKKVPINLKTGSVTFIQIYNSK